MSATEKTIGIIVARMTSSRLPGKGLRMVNGRPLLAHTLERLQAVKGLDEIWLASTQHPSDEQLLLWGIQQELHVFAYPGEMDDMVGRVTGVLNKANAQRFLMVLGDTPFPDVRLMQRLLGGLDEHPDWENITLEPSDKPCIHCGIVCYRASGWRKVDIASQEPKYREHPGSVLQEQPNLITRGYLTEDPMYYVGPYRMSVDTLADLEFADNLAKALQKPGEIFSAADIVRYLQEHPELTDVNTHVRQKGVHDEPLKILIATQGGGDYGSGHVARCKTLARTLTEHFSAGITFWLDTPQSSFRQTLSEDGLRVVEGNWSLPETLRQGKFNRLVVDFQTPVTPSLIQSLRIAQPDLPVIILDNNGLGVAEADAVIFPNVHAQPNPQIPSSHLYQGPDYILLGAGLIYDKENLPEEVPLSTTCILVTMGGRDPELMTEKVLDALKDLKECHIDLVVPPMYPYPENLEKIATVLPSTVTLHWRVQNLKPLMRRATLAVCTFGITAYELAYMAVPTLLLTHTETQIPDMERFCQWGSAIPLGWGKHVTSQELFTQVCSLIEDKTQREQMREKGQILVNTQGAVRIAEVVISTVRAPLSLVSE